jgi:hypothetical protein
MIPPQSHHTYPGLPLFFHKNVHNTIHMIGFAIDRFNAPFFSLRKAPKNLKPSKLELAIGPAAGEAPRMDQPMNIELPGGAFRPQKAGNIVPLVSYPGTTLGPNSNGGS